MPEDYTVEQGDCLNSIAFGRGFFWESLWNHANNADLRQRRKDPSVLMAGDVVHIPDLRTKEESGATEQRHRFRLRGVPAKLRIRLCLEDTPRANEAFTLYVDGVEAGQGQTDADGYVELAIPPDAAEGRLLVGTGDEQDVIVFRLGTLDPIDTDEGVRGRLRNLGFDVTDLAEAVRAFQTRENLSVSGTPDEATRARLRERFGQ